MMSEHDQFDRRGFLRRLPHLLAGGAIASGTAALMWRSGGTSDDCRLVQPCLRCRAYDWCDLDRAIGTRDLEAKRAPATRVQEVRRG